MDWKKADHLSNKRLIIRLESSKAALSVPLRLPREQTLEPQLPLSESSLLMPWRSLIWLGKCVHAFLSGPRGRKPFTCLRLCAVEKMTSKTGRSSKANGRQLLLTREMAGTFYLLWKVQTVWLARATVCADQIRKHGNTAVPSSGPGKMYRPTY